MVCNKSLIKSFRMQLQTFLRNFWMEGKEQHSLISTA